MNKPYPFPDSYLISFLLNLTYTTEMRTAGKSGKQIERCVISTFRIAESMGFQGDFCQWEHLLRLGDFYGPAPATRESPC